MGNKPAKNARDSFRKIKHSFRMEKAKEDGVVAVQGAEQHDKAADNGKAKKPVNNNSNATTRPSNKTESKLSEIKIYYDVDWSPAGVLGKGHYAVVYKGANKATKQKVAVKRIKRSLTRLETLQTEVRALRKVKGHPNIVHLYDVFFDDTYVVLVMELLAGGELFDRIVENGAYSERDASIHMRKIASALKYMHNQGIVHRDLKPENLVLADHSPGSEIKISDFGLSKILKSDQQTMQTVCGTRAYSAPEVGFGGPPRSGNYNAKVDTWSLGVILYVILAAYHPFDPYGDSPDHVIWGKICGGKWDFNDPNWDTISEEAKDLISNLLKVDVRQRFGTEQILNHTWITQYNNVPSTPLKSLTSSRSLRNFKSDKLPFTQTLPDSKEEDQAAV